MLLWPRGCFQCLEAVNKGVEVPIDNEEDDLMEWPHSETNQPGSFHLMANDNDFDS